MGFSPIAKENQLLLGNPNSPVAICCLWSVKEKIAASLSKEHYACIGNLYSASRGINWLLVNLLANPSIRFLFVYGNDRSDSKKALQQVWESDLLDYFYTVDGAITEENLELLRDNVNLRFFDTVDQLKHALTLVPNRGAWGNPVIITIPDPVPEQRLPAQDSGFLIRGQTVADCWTKILHEILPFGRELESGYDSQHIELLNLVTVIENEETWPVFDNFPEFVTRSSSDTASADAFERYWQYVSTSDGEQKTTYTYGDRIRFFFNRDQIEDVINKLVKEPISKSAVISLWAPDWDNTHSGSPCLNQLWFRIREGKLYLTVVIRSNDMFAAWPANAYTMRRLQALVRSEIEEWNFGDNYKKELDPNGDGRLGMGSLTIVSESAHLYAHSYDDAQAVVNEQYHKTFMHDLRRYEDPKGSLVISIEQYDTQGYYDAPVEHAAYLKEDDYFISVKHISMGDDGLEVGFYGGETALDLCKQLAEANVLTDPYHMLYIGTELMKAEIALKVDEPKYAYEQDKPLDIDTWNAWTPVDVDDVDGQEQVFTFEDPKKLYFPDVEVWNS